MEALFLTLEKYGFPYLWLGATVLLKGNPEVKCEKYTIKH